MDCVRGKSLQAFTEHYQKWCKRNGYNFSALKAEKIYQSSSDLIAVFPKDDSTKTLIRQAVTMLNTASQTVEALRLKMDQTAATLPEYPVVMAMNEMCIRDRERSALFAIPEIRSPPKKK